MVPQDSLDATDATKRDRSLPYWREARLGLDWLALQYSAVFAGQGVLRGDGAPVILVPGLFASDLCFRDLRMWLARIGYRPYLSGIGRNIVCPDVSVGRLLGTINEASAETSAKVRLIGHSLGGMLARGAARRRPDLVAQVITLGSPLTRLSVHPAVARMARAMPGSCTGGCLPALQRPLARAIAQTCVYTKADGIVDWQACTHADARNVEVSGTHIGLIFNVQVYECLARELASVDAGRIRCAAERTTRRTAEAA